MIPLYTQIWQRLQDYGVKYQSGLDVVNNFNTRLAEVQNEVYSDLSPFYQVNEKVRGILEPWRKKVTGTATNSLITIDNTKGQFDRIISMGVTESGVPTNILYEINPIMEGELVMANRIPQRKPSLAKKRVYYIVESQSTVASPQAVPQISLSPLIASLPYVAYYLVYPYEAKIAFTISETADEDILTYDASNTKDLAWNMDAANIILYKMLEKYGIGTRDAWLAEYSRLGIQQTMAGGQVA